MVIINYQLPLPTPEADDLSIGSASKAKDRRARERLGVEPKFRPIQPFDVTGFPTKHPGKTLLSMKNVGCLIGIPYVMVF